MEILLYAAGALIVVGTGLGFWWGKRATRSQMKNQLQTLEKWADARERFDEEIDRQRDLNALGDNVEAPRVPRSRRRGMRK